MSALTAMTAHAARHDRPAATAAWSLSRDSGMCGHCVRIEPER